MQVKKKMCKGTGDAIGFGCGTDIYEHKFGLCKSCLYDWATESEKGKIWFDKQTAFKNKEKQKEVKKEINVLKEKNLTPDKYRATTVQPKVNKIARLIDFSQPCVATGKFGKMNGGHRIAVGANRTTALNLHNIHIQSYYSNSPKGGDNIKYDIGIENIYGIKYLDFLKGLHKHRKLGLTVSDLKEINSNAIEIIKELESNLYVRTPQERIELRNEINLELGIYEPEFCVFNL